MPQHLFLVWCHLKIGSSMMSHHFPWILLLIHFMVYNSTCWQNDCMCSIIHMFLHKLVYIFPHLAHKVWHLERMFWYWDTEFFYFPVFFFSLFLSPLLCYCQNWYFCIYIFNLVHNDFNYLAIIYLSKSQNSNSWVFLFKMQSLTKSSWRLPNSAFSLQFYIS